MKANNKNLQWFYKKWLKMSPIKLDHYISRNPMRNNIEKILLLTLVLSFNLFAQEQKKYFMLKPLTWEELQLYQLDSLKSSQELNLATVCPSTLKKLQNELTKKTTHMQHIQGIMYYWTEYENSDGLFCIVKYNNVDSLNGYQLLDLTQMRVLKSASLGGGNSEKELFRASRIMELNRKNQAIQAIPYEKYGGIKKLMRYMNENIPEDTKVIKALVDRTYIKRDGSVGWRSYTPIELFEYKYSEKQQNELMKSAQSSIEKE